MKNLICFLPLFLIIHIGMAQTLLSSGGSFHQGSTFNLHWSLGEFIVDTHTENSFTLSKGFHQGALKISTSVQDRKTLLLEIYPIPAVDLIHISGFENLTFEANIFDNTGRLVRTFLVRESIVDISDLKNGLYHIVFKNTNFVISPVKFIKI